VRVINPAQTTTYTLTVKGAGSPVSKPIQITVLVPPKISQFEATQDLKLRWTVDGAETAGTEISIDPDIGTVGPRSSAEGLSVHPTSKTTYTITAKGPGGTDSKSATVDPASQGPQ
jgi:hypothetical protein